MQLYKNQREEYTKKRKQLVQKPWGRNELSGFKEQNENQ